MVACTEERYHIAQNNVLTAISHYISSSTITEFKSLKKFKVSEFLKAISADFCNLPKAISTSARSKVSFFYAVSSTETASRKTTARTSLPSANSVNLRQAEKSTDCAVLSERLSWSPIR